MRVGDSPGLFSVSRVAEGLYSVTDGRRTWRVAVAGPPDSRFAGTAGASARIEVEPEDAAPRARARAVPGATMAPMPGTVIEIAVEVGQQVRAGDVLMTLEAMKMELPIRAPREGTVAAIRCRAGELVRPGLALVDIA